MMVMPANNSSGLVHYWAGKIPGKLGHITSPSNRRSFYPWIPAALDNDRFNVWARGMEWSEEAFIEHIEIARHSGAPLLWLLVPDVRLDREGTIEDWHRWKPRLEKYGIPLAFAVQDGMSPDDVPKDCACVFIGGTDEWRYPRLAQFLTLGKPVHIGRVNSPSRLWQLYDLGVTSCDGSGWFRREPERLRGLIEFWEFQAGERPHKHEGQMTLTL